MGECPGVTIKNCVTNCFQMHIHDPSVEVGLEVKLFYDEKPLKECTPGVLVRKATNKVWFLYHR